jgi:hypothetical protein
MNTTVRRRFLLFDLPRSASYQVLRESDDAGYKSTRGRLSGNWMDSIGPPSHRPRRSRWTRWSNRSMARWARSPWPAIPTPSVPTPTTRPCPSSGPERSPTR